VRAATALPSQYKTVSPVGNRVFVKVDTEEATSAGGILLPTSAQKKPTQGEVVSLGDAKSLQAGDKVVYSKYAGTEVALDKTDYVLLKEEDVIGVMPSPSIPELLPLGDRILIEVADAEEQTAGGLLMSAAAAEKPTLGKVIKVGSGRVDEKTNEVVKPNVEVGSTVLYSKYSGTEFSDDDTDKSYIVVRESDIIAALA
jgi:chaperonin GroES